MEIREFTEKIIAGNDDLLLLQDGTDNFFKRITRANLLAGLNNGGESGASSWQLKSSNYTALAGDRLLIDLTNSWTLMLPTTPTLGSEIEIYVVSKAASNKLTISFQGVKLKSTLPQSVTCNSLYAYTKLIYINDAIGWLDLNNILQAVGNYSEEILKNSPYIYLRLNELSGTQAVDASINNRNCQYQGTINYQQESSLASDTGNKSVQFNGSNSRIFVNPEITAPPVYAVECRFKTVNSGGQLFCFLLGGSHDRDLYLVNGKLTLFNFQGSNITTPLNYNDDNWHIVTAVTCSRGSEIWVDSNLVVSSATPNTVSYTGNWHVGYGVRGGYFNGLIDEASINHSELSSQIILDRHRTAMA